MFFGNFNYFRKMLLCAFYCISISHICKVYTFLRESKPFSFKNRNQSFEKNILTRWEMERARPAWMGKR